MVWDGQELKPVSWNNAGDDYVDTERALKLKKSGFLFPAGPQS